MNKMRSKFKQLADEHSCAMQNHMGELLDDIWEVTLVCSRVVDRCLQTDFIVNDVKRLYLILVLRNLITNCIDCLDSIERGHDDRLVYNSMRMGLEDVCSVIEANDTPKILELFYEGEYQASGSITFVQKNYPNYDVGKLYGLLSRFSHHKMQELVVRQWVNRDGLLSHLKPFDPKRIQSKLHALILIMSLARIAGEIAEKITISALPTPYFWDNPDSRKKDVPIDVIVDKVTASVLILKNPENADAKVPV